MCHQEEFLGLTANKLIELTASDELEVEKEETVFQAVARWYNHSPETRGTNFYLVIFLLTTCSELYIWLFNKIRDHNTN